METSISSTPPRPKTPASSPHLRETWRPTSARPSARTAGEQPTVEQRATARTRVHHAVTFSAGDGERRSGLCRNLSLGGVAIETVEPAPFGCRVTVFMELDGLDGKTALRGTVRWSKQGLMGVQWDSLGARVTHAILRTAAQGG